MTIGMDVEKEIENIKIQLNVLSMRVKKIQDFLTERFK